MWLGIFKDPGVSKKLFQYFIKLSYLLWMWITPMVFDFASLDSL